MKYIFIFFLLLNHSYSFSQITYVNQNANGENNGSSWENAFNDLDFAIENTNFGEIWVAQGTYIPSTDLEGNVPSNEKLKTFRLKKDVAIFGGFLGNETERDQRNWENNLTILSGDVGELGSIIDNSYHVISSEYVGNLDGAILDGLVVRDGNGYPQYEGAGIYINYAPTGTFIIRNCVIENNYSYRNGGGVYIFNSDPLIENNIFRNNQSFSGGAIYLYYSNAIVKNNILTNNKTDNYDTIGSSELSGGAIYVSSYSSPVISNNAIIGNSSIDEGGGITIDNNYHVVFQNNFVSENSSDLGGGIFLENSSSFFFNNVIHKNTSNKGGGLYADYTPIGPEFINNTVIGNEANNGSAMYLYGSAANVVNSIFYNNLPITNQIQANSNAGNWAPKIRYSSFENGISAITSYGNELTYENNYEIIPIFVDEENNNYALHESSELINSGTISNSIINQPWNGSNGEIITLPNIDIIGNHRIVESIDLGAYEFQSPLSIYPDEKTKIYPLFTPNPSNGKIQLNFPNYDSFKIYDLNGKKIKEFINYKESVDLFELQNGIYLVVIEIDGAKYFDKLIVNNK